MSAYSYIRVRWLHRDQSYPVELWSELDALRFEIRKIEVWSDGRVGFASRERESGGTMLGEAPLPSLAEIAADPEFEPEQISELEFEKCWRANVR